ncbi:hypothetical protein ABH924_001126 [Arthrobacter sp. GAS37]
MAANRIFMLPMLAAPACFAFAAVGGSYAVVGWIGGLLMIGAALFLRTREWKSERQDNSNEDRA